MFPILENLDVPCSLKLLFLCRFDSLDFRKAENLKIFDGVLEFNSVKGASMVFFGEVTSERWREG